VIAREGRVVAALARRVLIVQRRRSQLLRLTLRGGHGSTVRSAPVSEG